MYASPIIKPTHDDVEAVKAKTDNLPTTPADEATLTAMKQKDTSPAFDSDSDSLEALAEAIAGVGGGGGYTDNNIITYPILANRIQLQSGPSGSWSLGSWVQVIASNVITSDFLILGLWCWVKDTSTSRCIFEAGVGESGSESMVVQIPFIWDFDSDVSQRWLGTQYIYPRKVAANSRVSARFAVADKNSEVGMIKIVITEI